jgi:hypothetical protein
MITTRTISHKNAEELVPWGTLYPAATQFLSEPALEGTTNVTGMFADAPGRISTGETFSHVMASAGLAEYVTSIGEFPAFIRFSGVIGQLCPGEAKPWTQISGFTSSSRSASVDCPELLIPDCRYSLPLYPLACV